MVRTLVNKLSGSDYLYLRSFFFKEILVIFSRISLGHNMLFVFVCFIFCLESCNGNSVQEDLLSREKIFFDDFIYSGSSDTNLTNFGWHVRSGKGGPGPEGADWVGSLISFPDGPVNKVLRLKAEINNSNLIQSELNYDKYNMFEGTYAARVYYTNEPDSGNDGARLVQAGFWLMGDYNKTKGSEFYSECDFEYLPNGGWGFDEPVMHYTTWYNDETRDNVHNDDHRDFKYWHTVLIVVSEGHVKYYDGAVLLADHSGKFYPRTKMNILSNLWFLDNVDKTINSIYHIDVDWVFYVQNKVLTVEQVNSEINKLRDAGVYRRNEIK